MVRGRESMVWWGGFAAIVLWLTVIYGPGIGHGFVKDDVAWVAANRVSSLADLKALAGRSNGFYRPLVASSFAIDRAIYGIEPFGYGATNLLLLIASAAALVWMARGIGLSAIAAVIAAAIWAFNLHGIHMAVLWLSGRTALWLVLCAFVGAGALARGWAIAAGVAALAAMLAKEEGVMLPAMLTAWAFVLRKPVVRVTWPSWIALGVYFALRSQTAAYTPATSPWFYQFTFDPFRVLTNAGEYLDRACTFSAIVVVLCALLAWTRPRWTPELWRIFMLALIWLIGGYALTLFLPVRSSLYACFPSAGIAILAAAVIASLPATSPISATSATSATSKISATAAMSTSSKISAMSLASKRMLLAAALPVLLLPIYWSRNERWVELADLGADTFARVREVTRETPNVEHVVFKDDRETRRSLLNTYGTLLPPAIALAAGRPIPVWLDPPPDDWQGSELRPAPPGARVATFQLKDGRLVRVP